EPRDQNGGVWPVELLVPEVVAGRGDAEAAALEVVQDGGEDAGGVEVWQAEPVDGAVHPYQRGRAQVADDAVMLDGLVARSHRMVLPCQHPFPGTLAAPPRPAIPMKGSALVRAEGFDNPRMSSIHRAGPSPGSFTASGLHEKGDTILPKTNAGTRPPDRTLSAFGLPRRRRAALLSDHGLITCHSTGDAGSNHRLGPGLSAHLSPSTRE